MIAVDRVCTKCGLEKPLEDFPANSRYRGGRSSWCKECHSGYGRKWYQAVGKVRGRKKYEPDPSLTEKACGRCGETKPISQFSPHTQNRDGYFSYCKACNRQHVRDYSDGKRNRVRKEQIERETAEWRAATLERQNYACALCQRPFGPGLGPRVDHCHETGKLRGLLCGRCNTGLAFLGDDVDSLQRATDYVGSC